MINNHQDQGLTKVLSNLKDIHLPSENIWDFSLWWPPAPGQAISITIVLVFFVFLIIKNYYKLKKTYQNKLSKQALRELDAIKISLNHNKISHITALQQIIKLLRRCILALSNKKNTETTIGLRRHITPNKKLKVTEQHSLNNTKLIEILNKTGKTNMFTSLVLTKLFNSTVYQSEHQISDSDKKYLFSEIEQLIITSKDWIKKSL